MIIGFIINGLLSALDAFFSLFPTWNLPNFSRGANDLGVYAQNANRVFPVATTVYCLVGVLALRLLLNAWDLAVFVYHQFWGSS